VIGTLAVDGWAVTFGTAWMGLGGLGPHQSPFRCTKCNNPPINGQCTNYILFDVALSLDSKGLIHQRSIDDIFASRRHSSVAGKVLFIGVLVAFLFVCHLVVVLVKFLLRCYHNFMVNKDEYYGKRT